MLPHLAPLSGLSGLLVRFLEAPSREAIKEVHRASKEAFVKLMQSKLFAVVLMICMLIPVVQFIAYIAANHCDVAANGIG